MDAAAVADRLISLVRCPEGSGQEMLLSKASRRRRIRRFAVADPVARDGRHRRHLVIGNAAAWLSWCRWACSRFMCGGRGPSRSKAGPADLRPRPARNVEWPRSRRARQASCDCCSRNWDLSRFSRRPAARGCTSSCRSCARTRWEDAKAFCRAVADLSVTRGARPIYRHDEQSGAQGKDFHRLPAQRSRRHGVAAYSTAGSEGATVSVPIAWEEFNVAPTLGPFHDRQRARRTGQTEERSWADLASVRQSITASALRRLKLS